MVCLRQAVVICVLEFGGTDFSDSFVIFFFWVFKYLEKVSSHLCGIDEMLLVIHLCSTIAA